MPTPEPLRGEIWDVRFPSVGEHPAIVLSINSLNSRLGHVAVIPITGTTGPAATHIPLEADAGLTRYAESYADVTALQPIARGRCRKRRGLLTRHELVRVESQLRTYLGL
ncbi:MAG: type II toxin-antitoxin system PemK/MazF family toxin [Pseudonocardia sp.]